jgi:hypothetical protein
MAFERYQKMGGTLPFEVFAKEFATENFNSGGRAGYQEGTPNPYATNLMPGTLPGFLTSFGLDLLSRPPQGGFFQTVAASAKGPFETFQAAEMARAQQKSERDFLRGETDRKLTAADERLDKEIASREKIAGMGAGDEKVALYAEIYKDTNGAPNIIKGQNAVDFFETKYNELTGEYGTESVAVEPIDVTLYQSQKNIKKFRNANPGAEGKVFFDVASGKGVKLVKDVETGDLKFIPADSADIDTSGDAMPPPNTTPGLFGQKTKPDIITPKIKELGEEFSEEMYQTP